MPILLELLANVIAVTLLPLAVFWLLRLLPDLLMLLRGRATSTAGPADLASLLFLIPAA